MQGSARQSLFQLFVLFLTPHFVCADIGLLSFWIPELRALLSQIEAEGNPVETYVIGPRKFYVASFRGHNVVAVNTGVGISNSVIATTMLLTHFPSIDRIIGSGVAGGIDPSLRVGDVVIPDRWALPQFQLFAKEVEEGVYEPPGFEVDILVGPTCGGFDGVDTFLLGEAACAVNAGEASNFGFIFPKSIPTPDPNSPIEVNRISEGSTRKWWFDVDPQMLEIATQVAPTVELSNESGGAVLDYTPVAVVGGAGISGPTFLDNVEYREYCFAEFGARAVDMETGGAAHVASQFGKPFIFFRSLSDLAGADQDFNVIGVFFAIAAANAVQTLSVFLEELPVANASDGLPLPVLFTLEAKPDMKSKTEKAATKTEKKNAKRKGGMKSEKRTMKTKYPKKSGKGKKRL